MRKLSISQAKTANVEVTPANVTVNVTNVRPYTKSEKKSFSDVILKSIRTYDLQMVKNCEVQLRCIEHFAAQKFENMNLFWTLYMQRADVLLNSRRFVIEAKRFDIDPVTLATNIVARGATLVKKVATYGIAGSQIDVDSFRCQIVPDSVIRRFMENPEEFYPEVATPIAKNADAEQPAA